jgi:hypothetical protein
VASAVGNAPPFRVEHVGSFVRPDHLVQASRDHRAGKIDNQAFKQIQDQAVTDIIRFHGGGSGQTVTQDDTRRKLELVLEVASSVWGSDGR